MIKCPLCNSGKTKFLYKHSINDLVRMIDNCDKRIEVEVKKIWGKDFCKFMECKECSFAFVSPFKGGTNNLYSLLYSDNYPTERWEYDLALKDISPRDICLEIGAGKGMFQKKLLKEYKEIDSCTIEISNDESDYKSLKDTPNKKKFSVVFMFQVLEHLDNFKEVIDTINKITTSNAKLIISVPHESTIEFFRKKGMITDNPPIHVSRWNEKTIGMLEGWKIQDYQIKSLGIFKRFKYLFYGTRTMLYPKTRNPYLLIDCFLTALTKMGMGKLIDTQYFYLTKR